MRGWRYERANYILGGQGWIRIGREGRRALRTILVRRGQTERGWGDED